MIRYLARLAGWTGAWTVYLWWAAIGWPDNAETAQASLAGMSAASILGLVAWYVWQPRAGPAKRLRPGS